MLANIQYLLIFNGLEDFNLNLFQYQITEGCIIYKRESCQPQCKLFKHWVGPAGQRLSEWPRTEKGSSWMSQGF